MQIDRADRKEIENVLQRLKHSDINFEKCSIDPTLIEVFKREISKTNFHCELSKEANKSLNKDSTGYLLIDFGDNLFLGHNIRKSLLIILSGILNPFGIFAKQGLWKEIGVDLNKEPNRSSGTGYNPFHIDFVNTSQPPFYSILFCVREDPNGGGQTIISNFYQAIAELSKNELEHLKEEIYEEGSFFDLNNVGVELNPFPVIQPDLNGETVFRFTSKIKTQDRLNYLIKKLEEVLIRNQEKFLLRKNQLVIFNQRIICHGKLELKGNQEKINPHSRRLLLQTFGKKYEES